MPVQTTTFTTGPSTLPDVGQLSYNGCVFSPLFETKVSGDVVQDNARRTTKVMEYTITADGYVTLTAPAISIAGTTLTLQQCLTAHGGRLQYTGRGFDILLQAGTGSQQDLEWGPVPKLFEFQPLGGGLSAKVQWEVKVRVSWLTARGVPTVGVNVGRGGLTSVPNVPLLQFNCETVVGYGEDGFSSMLVKGTMEIPLTRTPNQATRTLNMTVDNLRTQLDSRIFAGIDLSRFRVVRRNYSISRDKRSLEFDVQVEEKPYMDLPPDCTIARGTYSVRPAKVGMGLCLWLCTLRASYVVRADRARRNAWFSFLWLLRWRMSQSILGNIPGLVGGNQNPPRGNNVINPPPPGIPGGAALLNQENKIVSQSRRAFLVDFSFDEGLYLDSKTTSFSATWRLVTTFSNILLASGIWKKVPEKDSRGKSLWSTSMLTSDGVSTMGIAGSQSWLANRLDPKLDIIVDFGGN